jgi:hypothetical protein
LADELNRGLHLLARPTQRHYSLFAASALGGGAHLPSGPGEDVA